MAVRILRSAGLEQVFTKAQMLVLFLSQTTYTNSANSLYFENC